MKYKLKLFKINGVQYLIYAPVDENNRVIIPPSKWGINFDPYSFYLCKIDLNHHIQRG